MESQQFLFKGELMEELLRNYFLGLGYFVVRGVKYNYQNSELTDVDLFLYKRNSSLTRERINVDIKNKKTPQALERILWANGIMTLLGFDSCVVATRDTRPIIHSFGLKHQTQILDGVFLSKLAQGKLPDRLSEEEFHNLVSKHTSHKKFDNKDWRFAYERSKSRLLNEQDFSGLNSALADVVHFIEVSMTDERKFEAATRMMYITISHLLIIIDFILKDIVFLEPRERERKLSEGFTFGNLGKEGVGRIISIAAQISGSEANASFLNSLKSDKIDMLTLFFSKPENANGVFLWAREFSSLATSKKLINPNELDSSLKGFLSLLLDFAELPRRTFFDFHLKQSSEQRTQTKILKVLSATYGTSKNTFDLTDAVTKLIKDNKLNFTVTNDIAGDPDLGTVKDFQIVFEFNGKKEQKSFKEGDLVLIPSQNDFAAVRSTK